MMELREIPVENILPQRSPFIMISRITGYEDGTACTELDVAQDNIFVDDGLLSYSGLVENMAQTCAAMVGYHNRYVLGNGVCIGMIGAVRNVMIHSRPSVGQTVCTRIEVITEVFNVKMAKAEIRDAGGNLMAEGIMKIALTDSQAQVELSDGPGNECAKNGKPMGGGIKA